MNRLEGLYQTLQEKILILDGAMGTMIQQYQLSESDFRGERFIEHAHDLQGFNDILCLTQPDIIEEIHTQYIQAGADLIETNTFNATTIAAADYHLEHLAYEINFEASRLARNATDRAFESDGKLRWVAGAIGPTNRTASISPKVEDPGYRNVSFEELAECYYEAAKGLLDGGAEGLEVARGVGGEVLEDRRAVPVEQQTREGFQRGDAAVAEAHEDALADGVLVRLGEAAVEAVLELRERMTVESLAGQLDHRLDVGQHAVLARLGQQRGVIARALIGVGARQVDDIGMRAGEKLRPH